MTRLCAVLIVIASAIAPPLALAQQYPVKPVRLVVPFPPGGGNDIIGRFVAERLTAALGKQVFVENKPGADGTIGIEAAIKSPPDGYTLLLVSSAYTVHPSLYKLRYDPVGDATPIIQISQGPLVVVVHPSLPVKSVQELIQLAKSKPGKLNFASPGQGGTIHLATELFAETTGIKMNHVPYKGSGPALTDTIAGHTDILFSGAAPALPQVKAGKLRAIAVTTSQRIAAAPDVPTIAESGVPGYEVVQWYGLFGPKGLSSTIVTRLNQELRKLLDSKDTIEKLQSDGASPAGGTPEQLHAMVKKEVVVWRKVVTSIGLKAE